MNSLGGVRDDREGAFCHEASGRTVTGDTEGLLLVAVRRLLARLKPANCSPETRRGESSAAAFVPSHAITVLQLRPNCECCDRNLPPGSELARICSFECTFCAPCADTALKGVCPNCGGELVSRPRRPATKLDRFPASTERVHKPQGCGRAG